MTQLGAQSHDGNEDFIGYVFTASALESVRLPSTLKVIREGTFRECKNLRSVEFADGLEKIETGAFKESGIESIVFP